MSPASAPADEHDVDLRTPEHADAGTPEAEGLPEEEGLDRAEVEEGLDEEPESTRNRRDVPDTPENSIDARTEDDSAEEITEP
jgi:hypothetical protein